MKKKTKSKSHPLCRPPSRADGILRLRDDGRWVNDDHKPGLAFIGVPHYKPTCPVPTAEAWVANCSCVVHADCPASKALNKACAIYDGASLVRRPKVS